MTLRHAETKTGKRVDIQTLRETDSQADRHAAETYRGTEKDT